MKNSDKPTCGDHGGHKKNGEPCGYVAGWGTDFEDGKCKKHRGTSPDGSSHENNGNAAKHNRRADKSKLWQRMNPDRKELWEAVKQAQIDRHKERHGDDPNAEDIDAYEDRAWSAVLKKYSRDYMAECMEETGNPLMERVTRTIDGETVTYTQPNQLLDEITHNRREDRLAAKDRGMLNDPESQQAQAERELAQVARDALED